MSRDGGVQADGTTTAHDKPRVFLSYARTDRVRAAALAQALQVAGLDVWWDAEIEGGEAFAKRIETALGAADVVVVLWSQTSVASDWVRDEAGHGRDRKRLVPISLDGVMPPLGFRQYHALDFSRWHGAVQAPEIDSVIAAVRARAGDTTPPAPVARPRVITWSRRHLILAGGASAALVAIGGGLALWRGLSVPAIDHRSVAVLPFSNFTGDPQQQYFSDGLSDELRTTLAGDQRFKVMGQKSSASVGNDVAAAARKLGVAFLLSGGVQRSGDAIHVSAALTDGNGVETWAHNFEGSIKDIFAIQSEIAAVALAALTEQVDANGKPKPAQSAGDKSYGGTTNVDAYQAYLKGRELYQHGRGEAADRAALAQFAAAIAADPDFALARAAHARSLATIASVYAAPAEARTLYDQAFDDASKAASGAPDSAFIQSTLGKVLAEGRLDVRAARAPFEKAIALGGNDGAALTPAARFAAQTGHADEALSAIARAQDIDPLNPLVYRMAGLIRIALRQFDQALPLLHQSLALEADDDVSNAAIALVYLQQGRLDDARKAWQAEPDDTQRLTGLAIVERRLGHTGDAEAAYAALVKSQGDGALYQEAQVKAQWGNANEAMALLQRARTVGDAGLLDLKTDILLDPLRPDPRFSRLLSDIGFS